MLVDSVQIPLEVATESGLDVVAMAAALPMAVDISTHACTVVVMEGSIGREIWVLRFVVRKNNFGTRQTP